MKASNSCVFLYFCGLILFNNYYYVAGNESPKCASPCSPDHKTSIFKAGHTYVYHYKTDSFSYMNATNIHQFDSSNTSLTFSAEIDLHILSQCHFVMEIHNASLRAINGVEGVSYENFSSALMKSEVRLQYENGILVEMCVVKSEPLWVTNIKRGILSMLQFNLQTNSSNYTTYDQNIWGYCKTNYTTGEIDSWKTLKRKITYKDCLLWNNGELMDYNYLRENFYLESVDFFKNIQTCKYVLGNMGQPIQITCKERQKFHPHASKVNLAVSNITQHLDLDRVIIKEWATNVTDEELISVTLSFEFYAEDTSFQYFYNLQSFVNKTYNMSNAEIAKHISSHYFNVMLKNATYEEIFELLVVFNLRLKAFFSDFVEALFRAKSNPCIKMISDLYDRKKIKETQMIKWLISLSFIKYPNRQLLSDVKIFQDMHGADLPISGLVVNFCRNTPNCTDDELVKYYINYWDTQLKTYIKNFNQVKATQALLAIGNTGLSNLVPLIGEIVMNKTYPPMLRMTAIETLRKIPCDAKINYLKKAFARWADDAEVRISSYLALCQCPSNEILHQILVIFNLEGINEVTTFIWEHLTKSKTLPVEWKTNITGVLEDQFLKAEYMTYIPNHATYYEYYKNYTTLNSKMELIGITLYKNTLQWSFYERLSLSLFDNDVDKIEMFGRVRDMNKIIDVLFPRKNPSAEDLKYSSANSLADNIISVENNVNKPLSKYNYLQSGLINLRIFNNDLIVGNPFDVIHMVLEFIRTTSNINKGSLNMIEYLESSITYQFPTSVGYLLTYDILVGRNYRVNLSKLQQNYKTEQSRKFDMQFSGILNSHNILNIKITQDAYVTKRVSDNTVVFDFQTFVESETVTDQNKLNKFSFNLNPLLSDNEMFNVTTFSA